LARAKIQDVAKLAGVSIKTVSRVVNKEANVQEKTRQKVQRAIDRLKYQPNASARSLASTRSYHVGLLFDDHIGSYIMNIQTGVLSTSRSGGYDLVIQPCDYGNPELIASVSSMIAARFVDGLILTPPLSDLKPLLSALDKLRASFVLIAPADRSHHRRSVFTNDQEACAEMTHHLASLGHRRIGFVLGHPDHGAVGNRYLGYRDGLKEHGLKFDRQLVKQGYNTFESGVECGRRLLDLERPPTAIFAANDDMAAGVMKVAHQRGLAIPGDLSVAGFDDVPVASQLWPALTTIRQPMEEMAIRATALLLRQLRGEDDDAIEHTVASTLVVRESTGPVAG